MNSQTEKIKSLTIELEQCIKEGNLEDAYSLLEMIRNAKKLEEWLSE